MSIKYLKKSPKTSSTDDSKTTEIVKGLLKDIDEKKEKACIDLTKKFDKYNGDIVVSKEKIEQIKKQKMIFNFLMKGLKNLLKLS